MSELKPCPICGATLKIYSPEDWKPTFYDPDSGGDPYNAVCDCGFSFSTGTYDYAEFVAALNRRAQLANDPLTLDELRKMRGQVVDIPESKFWYSGRGTVLDDGVYDPKDQDGYWPFEYYGEWLAYDHKPGGEQDA